MKKKKIKRPRTSFEKEQSFIKISTNILLVVVIIISIIVAFNKTFGSLNLNNSDTSSLTALSALSNKVDTSTLITNQLSDSDKPTLIEKIKNVNLDILTNDEFDYLKYQQPSLNLASELNLSSNEVGLMYSYLFVNNPDSYDTIFYELSITKSDNIISIKTVASINFYNLFTSKINESVSLPKRVYLTNVATIQNGEYSFSSVLFNNLSSSESKEISDLVKQANSKINLNSYVPNLIISLINNIASKTSTSYSFDNNLLTLKKDAI